jgi:hypothetical protein
MAKILKHYRKNIERNLREALKDNPKVVYDMQDRVALLLKHRGPVYGLKISKGTRDSLAQEILMELSGKSV